MGRSRGTARVGDRARRLAVRDAGLELGPRLGPGLDATLEKLQRICDEQQLAAPITVHKAAAVID